MSDLHDWNALGAESLITELRRFCCSPETAQELTCESLFETEAKKIEDLYAVLKALDALTNDGNELSLPREAVLPLLNRASVSGIRIEPEEAAALFRLTVSCCRAAAFFAERQEEAAVDEAVFEILAPFFIFPEAETLRRRFAEFLTENGEIRSDLPELAAADRKIAQSRQQLLSAAHACFSRYDSDWFSSANETIRGGRVVLAVKAGFSYKIRGIVHESSGSGATAFIEPIELVDFNNRFMEACNEKKAAIAALLRRLSAIVTENRDLFLVLQGQTKILDGLQARLRFHRHFETAYIDSGEEIELFQLIHPQLGARAVPLELGRCRRCAVISGPNAGGKSVLLKSIGLAVFSHQCGLGIFADGRSRLPIFRRILCDIGDRQSINEALSTYSAHLDRMNRILAAADQDSLVLLDEFSSGTDPLEGGALALALLHALRDKKASVILTTHNNLLKERALLSPHFSAFAMVFDTLKMKPAYAVMADALGESHAIDIASAMNLPKPVLDEARLFLEKEVPETAKLMEELLSRRQELAKREATIREAEKALKEKERSFALKEIAYRSDVYRLKQDQKTQLSQELRQLRQEVRALKQKNETATEATLTRVENSLQTHTVRRERLQAAAAKEEKAVVSMRQHAFQVGEEVLVGRSRQRAILLRTAGKGKWVAQTDSLRLTVKEIDLTPCADSPKAKNNASVFFESAQRGGFSGELDVRGLSGEEAIAELESYLDRLILIGIGRFSVIHGTGEGILQKRIRDYLHSCRYVASYEFARPECGGFGKTDVILK